MKTPVLIMLAVFIALLAPSGAPAMPEYSAQTGLDCSSCHTNQLGGGELTGFGRAYRDELSGVSGEAPDMSKRLVRLIVGYLHILAGVVWFGTIFYVHIILKPAYAAKGLPKGELVLGWTCITITGVTGVLLTIARMDGLSAFYETRFGILLLVKIALFLVMAGTAGLATFVIGPRLRAGISRAAKRDGLFTPDELGAFDGKDGRKAYVAVDGTVYDVTASRLWKEGRHTRHHAGNDMTSAIRQAPHGPEKLLGLPVVGEMAEGRPAVPPTRPKAAFYFMAYMNLALVFLILGIVALWRWW